MDWLAAVPGGGGGVGSLHPSSSLWCSSQPGRQAGRQAQCVGSLHLLHSCCWFSEHITSASHLTETFTLQLEATAECVFGQLKCVFGQIGELQCESPHVILITCSGTPTIYILNAESTLIRLFACVCMECADISVVSRLTQVSNFLKALLICWIVAVFF